MLHSYPHIILEVYAVMVSKLGEGDLTGKLPTLLMLSYLGVSSRAQACFTLVFSLHVNNDAFIHCSMAAFPRNFSQTACPSPFPPP